jgi:ribosomal protein L11 methyltransferase
MVELFPTGFEEREDRGAVELAAYTEDDEIQAALARLGPVRAAAVAPGWEDEWRRFHRPVRIDLLWVGPPWEEPDPGALAVVIDPGRAFGTGAHPTTRLCLELLLGLERASLLDVGCGSGVLAVAAARLGFPRVLAVDEDPIAVEAARANAAANGVEVDVRLGDALADPLPAADIAVANIALGPVEAVVARFGGRLVLASGYLDAEQPAVPGWEVLERRTAAGWGADLLGRLG